MAPLDALFRCFIIVHVLANGWIVMTMIHRGGVVVDLGYPYSGVQNYSYIGVDYPVWLPIELETVEMSFSETARYSLDSSDTFDWLVLQGLGLGGHQGFIRLGPDSRLFAVAMFHELHCISNLAQAFTPQYPRNHSHHHVQHCLSYLRQLFLCGADVTLEPGDFLARNYTIDTSGITRNCRDWSMVFAEAEASAAQWTAHSLRR
ncbi:hypothetical protein EIP91_011917 [Steccherinum ochraceum]|uniref:Uncharacterized protein n=1 Tax=Steccherinum ochraceum TaxID=92696 RepID=A0A4R0RQV3_9APHY|nr:hypothetical protein EIP91_011917 [Steccherinum ochraceum]